MPIFQAPPVPSKVLPLVSWSVLTLLGVATIAVPIAWAQAGNSAQDRAIAAIEKLGGKVERDETAPDKPVIAVNFGTTQVGDEALANLAGLAKLQKLTLNGTKVTDAGLAQLKGLSKLQKLYLVDTKVGDAGLEHVKGLTELRVLSLVGTQVTDAGLDRLLGLKNLQEVFLAATKVTDAGVKKLQGALPKVKIER